MTTIKDFSKLKIDKQQDHVAYNDELHVYWNVNTLEQYASVTTFISQYKFEVDWEAIKIAISKRDKKSIEEIEKEWEQAKKEGTEYGSHYHEFEENMILANKSFTYDNFLFSLSSEIPKEYSHPVCIPEAIVYSDKLKLAGQVDIPLILKGYIHILDHKTNKKIHFKAHKDFHTKEPQRMKPPIGHLECCSFSHYCLQLNLYMYLLKSMRPNFKVGNRRILYFDKPIDVPKMKTEIKHLALDRLHQLEGSKV